MLDLKLVRKNPDLIREALRKRHSDINIDEFLSLDEKRRAMIQEVEEKKMERNRASQEVAKMKRAGQDASGIMTGLAELSDQIKALDEAMKSVDEAVSQWIAAVPNIPHESVPEGKSADDNPVLKTWGEKPTFAFTPKEHWEIGAALGGLDFERSAKITGARFALSWGWAAKLERALISFMLDVQTKENGYTEVMPPFIVNKDSLFGTGQLPKFAGDLFKLEGFDYYLIPTAEVPVTNIHRAETLPEGALPLAYTAHTPCFRSEAGSYGKDTKGLIRQHQFNKVELVRFVHPDQSYVELELLLSHAESILQKLGLHYRVITLCTGDMGFGSAKTYDIEVWLPGQNAYREISSCSNFEDFQARRAEIRFKPKDGKSQLLHTLNGSGLAVGRTLVAILENYQQADGSLIIPEALQPYMDGLKAVRPKGE